MAQALFEETSRDEVRKLASVAREARIVRQIDACRAIEKNAFQLRQLAKENGVDFLVYLLEMLRAAALDEQSKLNKEKNEPRLKSV